MFPFLFLLDVNILSRNRPALSSFRDESFKKPLYSSHLCFACSAQVQGSNDYCDKVVGGYNTTVLMVADPGSFTGSAEAKYYIQNLEASSPPCLPVSAIASI